MQMHSWDIWELWVASRASIADKSCDSRMDVPVDSWPSRVNREIFNFYGVQKTRAFRKYFARKSLLYKKGTLLKIYFFEL